MFDPSSSLTRGAIAETVWWCSLRALTAIAEESDEMIRRRGMIQEAHRLTRQAAKRRWFRRDMYKSRYWRQAMDLLKEADPDSLAPLEGQLRSPVLEPRLALAKADTEAEREKIVSDVTTRRSQLFAAEKRSESEDRLLENNPGRLLLYIPSENVSDGSSRYASKGFFDQDDTPPWDTWLHYSDRTLVSWVPAMLAPLAQAGIDANPVLCISWADSV